MESAFLAAAERHMSKAWRAGRWWRPKPGGDGPNTGDRRVHKMAPLYLEFMQAFTPHFHWIAASLRCSVWLVAKRTSLWLNHVSDTAEDYRLQHALPRFLEALRELSPDTWRSCLHVSTSPIPRAVGTWTTPLRDFNAEESWEHGDMVVKGASRCVSQLERLVWALRGTGVYQVPRDPLPPTCYPFVIPRSSEKFSLILSCNK